MGSLEQMRAGLESLAAQQQVPFSVHMDLTMACNHACKHCYRVVQERPELTTEEWLRVLHELHQLGSFFLTLSGGELTLRRDLWEILALAQQLKFSVRLKTNGYEISPRQIQRLVELGVAYLDVSLYGASAATHDGVTSVPGSWDQTCKNITLMSKADLRVNINMALINSNLDEAMSMKALVETLGARSVGFNTRIFPGTDGGSAPLECALEPSVAAGILRKLYPPGSLPEPAAKTGDSHFCSAGHSLLYIDPYGDVMPCVAFPLKCGSIKQRSIREIWYGSEKLAAFREARFKDLGLDSNSETTKTHCPGTAFVIHKDYLASEAPSRPPKRRITEKQP